jgi:peptide/nickel transport system substrate-binding protein
LYDLGPTTSATFLTFNQNPRKNAESKKPYVNPVKLAWFRNLKFRKAIDYAIQRDEIVNNVLQGVGAPLFTPEPLSSIFLNEALAKGHKTSVDTARQLLKEGGFKWDAQGRLFDSGGHRVEFEMMTNTGNLEREAIGVSVKEDLEALGIKVNFRPIDFNVLVGRIDSCNWEAIILGLTGGNTEPNQGVNVWRHDGAMHLFNSRKPDRDMPGTDRVDPWELQLDQLFASGATTLDMAKRREYYNAYQQVVVDHLPFIYLYSGKQILAMRNHIHNVDPTPLGGLIHNFESLWLDEKKKD